jgi:hypothetical protein
MIEKTTHGRLNSAMITDKSGLIPRILSFFHHLGLFWELGESCSVAMLFDESLIWCRGYNR